MTFATNGSTQNHICPMFYKMLGTAKDKNHYGWPIRYAKSKRDALSSQKKTKMTSKAKSKSTMKSKKMSSTAVATKSVHRNESAMKSTSITIAAKANPSIDLTSKPPPISSASVVTTKNKKARKSIKKSSLFAPMVPLSRVPTTTCVGCNQDASKCSNLLFGLFCVQACHQYCKETGLEANSHDMLTVFHLNFNYVLCYRTFSLTAKYDPKTYPIPSCMKRDSWPKCMNVLRHHKSLYAVNACTLVGASLNPNASCSMKTNTTDAHGKWYSKRKSHKEDNDGFDEM